MAAKCCHVVVPKAAQVSQFLTASQASNQSLASEKIKTKGFSPNGGSPFVFLFVMYALDSASMGRIKKAPEVQYSGTLGPGQKFKSVISPLIEL